MITLPNDSREITTIDFKPGVYQDGAQFYREIEGSDGEALIASYPKVVSSDFDRDGAAKARALFAQQFPEFIAAALLLLSAINIAVLVAHVAGGA